MPNASVRGPFGELHFGDELGAHPVRRAHHGAPRRRIEGRLLHFDGIELFAQLETKCFGPSASRADFPGEDEPITVVVSHEQGADAHARTLGLRESAYDELLAL